MAHWMIQHPPVWILEPKGQYVSLADRLSGRLIVVRRHMCENLTSFSLQRGSSASGSPGAVCGGK